VHLLGNGICVFGFRHAWRLSALGNFFYYLLGQPFTGSALRIIDAALGESQPTTARAAFRIHPVKCNFLLPVSQTLKFHARKFRGIRGIFEKNLASIDKRLNSSVDWHPQQGADFAMIRFDGIKTAVLLHDPALRVDYE
jgi:hypothetical protein